jgi:hypothetical protein
MQHSAIAALLLSIAPSALAQAGAWQQCGGSGFSGATTCTSGYGCVQVNEYYSQCQPGADVQAASTTLATSTVVAASSSAASSSPSSSTASAGIKCPIVLDGRVPTGTALTYFDTSNKLFNPDYVKNSNLKWSDILKLPSVPTSKFDAGGYEAVEVTISDKSIFQTQNGFRRAGLQFNADSSNDASDSGVMTIHFSVKYDTSMAFNLSHEYLVSSRSYAMV